jgi:predicted RNA-binding protein with PIN domain
MRPRAGCFGVSHAGREAVWFSMALIRILVDGYSLLHNWPELANGQARHSAAAREELIRRLTLYRDAIGTPITVFFDGGGAPNGTPAAASTPEMEVLYSRSGQTADEMIERATHRFSAYGEVMAVTDDQAERETVTSLGGSTSSCLSFVRAVEAALSELTDDIKDHNRRERHRFQRSK